MIVDIHTHTFPEKIAARVINDLSLASGSMPFTDGTVNGLLDSMVEAEVDLSVILPVATRPEQVEKINTANIEQMSTNGGYLAESKNRHVISFGAMHPDYENYHSELKRIKECGLKGIKVHPVYQDTEIDDVKYLRIFDRAAELNLVVIAHSGMDIGFPGVVKCSPKMSRNVIDKIGDFKLVLAHMGGWRQWDEVIDYLVDTKVYIDTAFSTGMITPRDRRKEYEPMLNEEEFMNFIGSFGAERILFGSDSPWSSQSESIKFIRGLPIGESAKDKILGINARQILR